MNKGILGIIIVLIVSILIVGGLALGGKGGNKPKEEGQNPGNDVAVDNSNKLDGLELGINEQVLNIPEGTYPDDAENGNTLVDYEPVYYKEDTFVFGGDQFGLRDGNFSGNYIEIKDSYTLEDGSVAYLSEDFQIEPSDYSAYKDGDVIRIVGRSPYVAWADQDKEAGNVTLDLSALDFDEAYILSVSESGLILVIKEADASKIVCDAENVTIKTV